MAIEGGGFYTEIPAIRGIQARREYYVAMCPLGVLQRLFVFVDDTLPPELRAQRVLNRARIPELVRYIVDNPDDYVFSAMTVSVDGEMQFVPYVSGDRHARMGQLRIPMDARLLINDGQHRRAAIAEAIKENPDLAHETIAVVFFHDRGLARSQQMFADLNRHAVRPARSLNILYDHRSETAEIARYVIEHSESFRGLVEKERTSLSPRSRKLFTLSAIHRATTILIEPLKSGDIETVCKRAVQFWDCVGEQIPDWSKVRQGQLTAAEVRQDFVHSSGVILQALGWIGARICDLDQQAERDVLSGLREVDWSKSNRDWEGVVLFQGRLKNSTDNVRLAAQYLSQKLGLDSRLVSEQIRKPAGESI